MWLKVAGVGIVTAFGNRLDAVAQALVRGESALRPVEGEGSAGSDRDFVGPAPEVLEGDEIGKGGRFLERHIRLALTSMQLALEDAGIHGEAARAETGVVSGPWLPSLESCRDFILGYERDGVETVSPMQFANCAFNADAAHPGIRLGLGGPNGTVSAGAVSGLTALACAGLWLRAGAAERVVVHAAQQLGPLLLEGHRRNAWLARESTDRETRCSPLDRSRSGTLLGEASVSLVVEASSSTASSSAAGHGLVAEPWLEFIGAQAGSSHDSDPSEDRVRRMLEQGLRLQAGQPVDHVIASANGDPAGDGMLGRALARALGDRVPVTALAGALGDLAGAAPLLGVALSLVSMRTRQLPPTLNHRGCDAGVRLNVPTTPLSGDFRLGLIPALCRSGAAGMTLTRPLEGEPR